MSQPWTKSAEDRDEIFEVEVLNPMKAVLGALSSAFVPDFVKIAQRPRILNSTVFEIFHGYNPQKIGMYFLKLRHDISAMLYCLYYIRNVVLTSEKTPKIQGLLL